jgi:hypothetical protein
MKTFKGPRKQGGWIGLAISAAGAAYKAYSDNKDKEDDQQNKLDQDNQIFQDRAWLDQQQRKFALQDRQYKENAFLQRP